MPGSVLGIVPVIVHLCALLVDSAGKSTPILVMFWTGDWHAHAQSAMLAIPRGPTQNRAYLTEEFGHHSFPFLD